MSQVTPYGRECHKDRAKVRQWEGSCLCQLDWQYLNLTKLYSNVLNNNRLETGKASEDIDIDKYKAIMQAGVEFKNNLLQDVNKNKHNIFEDEISQQAVEKIKKQYMQELKKKKDVESKEIKHKRNILVTQINNDKVNQARLRYLERKKKNLILILIQITNRNSSNRESPRTIF